MYFRKTFGKLSKRVILKFDFIVSMIKIIKKHPSRKWIITVIAIRDNKKLKYKLTRRIPELNVAETKIFFSKKKARKQFRQWLEEKDY